MGLNSTRRFCSKRLPFYFSLIASSLGVLMGSAAAQPAPAAVGYELSFPALGTLVTFKAYHTERDLVKTSFAAAEKRVLELADILTDYDPESETRQLTELAVVEPVKVSDDLWTMLEASQRWHHISEGAFDASLGSLTRLWRSTRRSKRIPDRIEIGEALSKTGWQHVRLNATDRTVKFQIPGLALDFGAIGKGFIVDEAFKVLQGAGLQCCLVDISGNMRVGLAPPGKAGWRIAIASPVKGGEALRNITLVNNATATSGDLWQFTVIDGVRRSHILDPKTGVGVPGPLSCTAVAENATDADAWATVGCVHGFEKAKQLLSKVDLNITSSAELLAARMEGDEVIIHTTDDFPHDEPSHSTQHSAPPSPASYHR